MESTEQTWEHMRFPRSSPAGKPPSVIRMIGGLLTAAGLVLSAYGGARDRARLARELHVERVTSHRQPRYLDGDQIYASRAGAVSDDGRYVAFSALSPWVKKESADDFEDVFVRDTWRRKTTIVSVKLDSGATTDGSYLFDDHSHFGGMSADGSIVLFTSGSERLVPGPKSNLIQGFQVFVRDMHAGQTRMVSCDGDGAPGNDGSDITGVAPISSDGRWVVFESWASNLAPGVPRYMGQYTLQTYVADLQEKTIALVSRLADGSVWDHGSRYGSISSNGRFIVAVSAIPDFEEDESNYRKALLVYERELDALTAISESWVQHGEGQDIFCPTISDDGTRIGFVMNGSPEEGKPYWDQHQYYVLDRSTGTLSLVSRGEGEGGVIAGVLTGMLSSDGRTVVFASLTPGLVPEDIDEQRDIFQVDLESGRVRLVSEARRGGPLDGWSEIPRYPVTAPISHNGQWCVFSSTATKPGRRDRNGTT